MNLPTSGVSVDFNRNGIVQPGNVTSDLDGNGVFNIIPKAENDWSRLDYSGGGSIYGTAGLAAQSMVIGDNLGLAHVLPASQRASMMNNLLIAEINSRRASSLRTIRTEDSVECAPLD